MARTAVSAATYYVTHEGRKLWAATKAEISRIAQQVADATGKPVSVHQVKPKAKAKAKPAVRKMTRNPDADLAYFFAAQQKAQRERAAYVNGTKARRLAKGLRGRDRGGALKAAERGAAKTAKFAVAASNRKESLTLFRATRRAAEDLADQFKAAGYSVHVREA